MPEKHPRLSFQLSSPAGTLHLPARPHVQIILFVLSCIQTRPPSFDSLEQNPLMFVAAILMQTFNNTQTKTQERERRERDAVN